MLPASVSVRPFFTTLMTTSPNLVDYPYAFVSPDIARVADLRRIYVVTENLNSQLSTQGSAVAAGSHKNVQWKYYLLSW